ncbi:hypothetical protein MP228_011988 [Amoeboaphelidium protococcarum]|nr:hypothetical protein MP228_011988 [Amoeboaphelidium protococcarum]
MKLSPLLVIASAATFTLVCSSYIRFQDNDVFNAAESCSNFQGLDSCRGDQTSYEKSQVSGRMWQTPPRSSPQYASPSWQDYGDLQGYADVQYNQDRSEAKVTVRTFTKNDDVKLEFKFGDNPWEQSPARTFSSESQSLSEDGLTISVRTDSNATLLLDPMYFAWQNPSVHSPHTENGQRGAIVELFGWPYEDVALECESMLGKAGYMGVKIYPPQEHVTSDYYLQNGELNPWYFAYQPVSYRLHSRLGSQAQLRDMIVRCRSAGVRVYADAVINHMTGGGNDVYTHRNQAGGSCVYWGAKNSSANSPYFTHSWTYENNPFTGMRPALEFPAVPYHAEDFHCERTLNDWASGFSLNYGWLVGLTDLNTEKEYVRKRIATYLTNLISIGFSGFRIDAAKHTRPDDLAAILGKTKQKLGGRFPQDFITWLEVIMGGERNLLACEYNNYNFYKYLDDQMKANGLSDAEIEQVKIWSSDYPKEHPICGRWILPASRFVIQNDDHDQQNGGSSSRDMADKGSVLVKDKDVEKHRRFEQQLFDRDDADWKIKMVMSGYTFMANGAQGYPDGYSDCSRYTGPSSQQCKSVPYSKAHRNDVCGYTVKNEQGAWAEGVYTRVHRDPAIVRSMRRWSGMGSDFDNLLIGLPQSCQ